MLGNVDVYGDPYPLWSDHGTPLGHAVGAQGVSATWWLSGGSHYEKAYFLDGNTVIEVRARDGSVEGSRSWAGPAGKTLTGYSAATRSYSPALQRWLGLVFATAKDSPSSTSSKLYVLEVDGVNATWYQAGSTYQFWNATPIAASSSPDGLYSRAFASTTAGGVIASRWNAETNTTTLVNLSAPPGKQLCGTIGAAEGPSGPSGSYRAYVFCTRRDAVESQVLFRFTTNPSGIGGSWPPWGAIQSNVGSVKNSSYALAATATDSDQAKYAHVLVLSASNRLLEAFTQPSGEMPPAFLDRGDDGEHLTRFGGIAAVPWQTGEANGFYLGPLTAAARLYHARTGGSSWVNHGSGNGFGFIASTGSSVEPSTALWRGRGITASVRVGAAVDPRVYTQWSNDDAENWTAPPGVALARGTVDDNLIVTNPVAAFTDDGKAYVQMWGVDGPDGGCSSSDVTDTEIYFVTTTDGNNFSTPVRVVSRLPYHPCDPPQGGVCAGDEPWCPPCHNEICDSLDTCWTPADDCYCHFDYTWYPIHGTWMAIEQRAGMADVVHMVWYDNDPTPGGKAQEHIFYARAVDPVQADPPAAPLGLGENYLEEGFPVVTVGAEGSVYVGTQHGLCRVDPQTWNSCWDVIAYDPASNTSEGGVTLGIPGTTERLNVGYANAPFALVASRNDPDKVYYAFQRYEEGDDGPLDLYFQTFTFDQPSGTFDAPGPIFQLTDRALDGVDQFQPSLTVMEDLVSDRIFASWYDRREDCLGLSNRCYRAKSATYSSLLGAFGFVQDLPIDVNNPLSDPQVLPPDRCDPAGHNLGAYHHVTADRLHSFHNVVGARIGGFRESNLARGWVSDGFWSWTY